jgi:3-dehydroquinate synthase
MIKLQDYEIEIRANSLISAGEWARKCLSMTNRLLVVSNQKVFGLYGEAVIKSLRDAGFSVDFYLIGDGERFKSFKTLEQTLAKMSESRLTRTDAVIALGGGVVGDLTGFAASIYLRGIPFLQIPTTLLAMIDSSVGGKTAVNTKFGKNIVGSFYQPSGVLVDVNTLRTLPKRELVSGFCEAIKQSIISDVKLFDCTSTFLAKFSLNNVNSTVNGENCLEDLIAKQIEFKAEIVGGDEKEDVERNDCRSRKILNFGHTIAHSLEKVTNYRRFKHGEAVGIGMLAAAEISKNLELLSSDELLLINGVIHRLGRLPKTSDLDIDEIMAAIAFDKKSVGNSVKWILIEKIGVPRIVDGSKIPTNLLKKSLAKVFSS